MAKDLISINDLTKKEILDLINFSNNFIDEEGNFRKEDLFPDKTVANVFCEPSTRTKMSFAVAAGNLGCNVLDFNIDSSSIQKGESIYETIDALNLMGVDLCVLRHPESVIRELSKQLPKMVFINAGEGSISHPTQALLDIKTIVDHKSNLDGLKIVIVGDLDHSRVTSSFVEAVSNFDIEELTFCGHPEMCNKYMDSDFGNYEPDMEKALKDADVVMTLRIQYERFEKDLNLDLETYKNAYQLSSEKLGFAKGDAIIMHPGPVNYIEITEAVYDCENSVIREQIANGVAIRMAVLSRFLSS
ncbi:MAG: aspartate carbamoyltransferase catalytic subunit [Gammaproteobacteria bacterium]|nr:aspartate carbamoyltransferase catalytic subunit [Gammaproteobacteria bacterium]|tara:strand:+ start:940 stop:1845 length:906 start_codon:yes stop_codon:yes gene_type:complete